MNVYELVEKLDGEIVLNRARVRVNGEIVVVGQVDGFQMAFTEAGARLAAEYGAEAAPEEPKKRGGRPPKAAVVESEPVTTPNGDLFDTPESGLT